MLPPERRIQKLHQRNIFWRITNSPYMNSFSSSKSTCPKPKANGSTWLFSSSFYFFLTFFLSFFLENEKITTRVLYSNKSTCILVATRVSKPKSCRSCFSNPSTHSLVNYSKRYYQYKYLLVHLI